MARAAARNAGHTLARVLDHTVNSAMSTSAEVTSNLILTVLRCHMMILLILIISYNVILLRVDINIVILIVQKNDILYDKVGLGTGCKN